MHALEEGTIAVRSARTGGLTPPRSPRIVGCSFARRTKKARSSSRGLTKSSAGRVLFDPRPFGLRAVLRVEQDEPFVGEFDDLAVPLAAEQAGDRFEAGLRRLGSIEECWLVFLQLQGANRIPRTIA